MKIASKCALLLAGMKQPIVVALAMPFRGASGDAHALALGTSNKSTNSGRIGIAPHCGWTSLLTYTFNLLWAQILNQRNGVLMPQSDGVERPEKIDYFAMIHDDIIPDPGWLDTLIDLLEANDADVVSAVVPIKDGFGLTSTGTDTTGDIWNPRRLTLTEVFGLPETFGDEESGGPLLLNTGLWVCRLDRPWVEKLYFRQNDKIVKNDQGFFEAHTMPEDWDFSRQVRSHGGKLLATRKVKLVHERPQWNNHRPWGTWTQDKLALEAMQRQGKTLPKVGASG